MTVSARKITAFAKLVAGLADTPNLGSTALLKQWFDSSPEELRVAVNGLIDDLIATAAGASGTEQIGSAPISGVAGATAYAQLVDLKSQLNGVVLGQIPPDMLTNSLYRQALINGNFDVWQRGMSFPATGYTADRWQSSASVNATLSKQATSPPIGSSTYARATVNTLGGFFNLLQAFESDICNKLKGKTVSVSIQLRRDATYDGQYQITIDKNASADTSAGTWVNIALTPALSLTTSWVTYKLENITIPNDGTTNGLRIQIAASGGARPVNSYVEFAQVQVNTGAVALPFQPRSYSQEEEESKRYCINFQDDVNGAEPIGIGYATSATAAYIHVDLGKTMRIAPTLVATAADWYLVDGVNAAVALTAISMAAGGNSNKTVTLQCTAAAGLTQYRPYRLVATGVSKKMIFDAEI